MNISVNNLSFSLFEGASVKNALHKYYMISKQRIPSTLPPVYDRYGNVVNNDGALCEGGMLYLQKKSGSYGGGGKCFLIAASCFIFMLCGCGTSKKAVVPEEQPVAAEQPIQEVVIIGVNDMHATLDLFPRFAYVIDSLRAIYPDLLLLSAGDNQTGNPLNDQHPEKGLPMVELMNLVKFNASVMGNHEFDVHPAGVTNLTNKSQFDLLCANMYADDSLNYKVIPQKVYTLKNGVKVGVVGMVQIGLNGIPDTHPNNTVGIRFREPVEVMPEYLYMKESCDLFVLLSHIGLDADIDMANRFPQLDLIVGGHSHTVVPDEQIHNGVLVTQTGSHFKNVSLIKVQVQDGKVIKKGMQLVPVKGGTQENAEVRAKVDKYNENPRFKETVAETSDDFSSHAELGYLMVDAIQAVAKSDISLQNPGGVRFDTHPKGVFTVMDAYRLSPFGNEIVVYNLTGKELYDLMVAAFPVDEHRIIHTAGIRTKVYANKEKKVTNIEFFNEDGSPFDMNRTYRVALNDYMAAVYDYPHEDQGQALFVPIAEGIMEYLREIKTVPSYRGQKRNELILSE